METNRTQRKLTKLLQLARELRTKQTPAETILWSLLRGRKFLGLKFRRQHRLGTFITDFYCAERHLVIEVDGEVHSHRHQQLKDENRDADLRSQGLWVLRFSNEQIEEQPEDVLNQIAEAAYSKWQGRGGPSGGGS